MKPTEDYNLNHYSIEGFDYEISPVEVVQDIGVLIVEGRLPEFSQNGRREGNHCWPVWPDSKKECCYESITDRSSMCYFVESTRGRIKRQWKESSSLFVEVLVCLDNLFPRNETQKDPCEIYFDLPPENASQRTLLLERWKLEICKKSSHLTSSFLSSSVVSINMLLQAIRSFLHFSQLSAWLIRTGGRVPSQIIYRIVHGKFDDRIDFQSNPEIHEFPQAMISKTENIRTTIFALPRFNLETLISMSPYREYNLPIERQILLSSLEKSPSKLCQKRPTELWDKNCSKFRSGYELPSDKKRLASCVKQAMNNDDDDAEETPSRKVDAMKKREKHEKHVDVIFVADPIVHLRNRSRHCKDGKISGRLRKRLSFEGSCANANEARCFRMQEKDSLVGRENALFNYDKFKDLSNYKGKNDVKKGIKNGLLALSKHSKSHSYLCENEKKTYTDKCLKKTGFCENSADDEIKCEKKLANQGEICKFQIGDENERKPIAEMNNVSCLNETICNNGYKQNNKKIEPDSDRCNVMKDIGMEGNSSFERNCNFIKEKIKELDLGKTKESELKTTNEKDANTCNEKLKLCQNGCIENEKVIDESKTEGKICTSLQREESSSMIGRSQSPVIDRCQSSRCLTSVEENKSQLDKLRRSVSYSGAKPKQITSSPSFGACSVAVFNSKTGLPIASSPAPLRKPEGYLVTNGKDGNGECSSPSIEIRKTRKSSYDNHMTSQSKLLLSRSAPASTRLLGNFEESVLKGRIPVFGTVEGFTADIGASGSFCPQHITIPVRCQFFRTSDDNAPSPYMGHISFKKSKGKRGYHVPRKGTIQLTLFNPQKTVVKVFVVIYNFEDMPSNSHTFLRQKIVSIRNNSVNEYEPQNLHYLVHLRFASTRHDHVYLHTDIRLIFPQQTPEISTSKLKVLTYGPVEPKYTLRDR